MIVSRFEMCNQNEWIVREAFLAYDRGDVARILEFIDPDLEWTYFEPGLDDARPQICGRRAGLEQAGRRQGQRDGPGPAVLMAARTVSWTVTSVPSGVVAGRGRASQVRTVHEPSSIPAISSGG